MFFFEFFGEICGMCVFGVYLFFVVFVQRILVMLVLNYVYCHVVFGCLFKMLLLMFIVILHLKVDSWILLGVFLMCQEDCPWVPLDIKYGQNTFRWYIMRHVKSKAFSKCTEKVKLLAYITFLGTNSRSQTESQLEEVSYVKQLCCRQDAVCTP